MGRRQECCMAISLELDELSAFAPAVEEQPFDRFYKKPAAASGPLTASQPAVAASPRSNTHV
jgi:hypothetical protein